MSWENWKVSQQQMSTTLPREQPVSFNPAVLDEIAIIERIKDIGYGVATGEIELPITGMMLRQLCGDGRKTLNKLQPSVVSASVNFAAEKAQVTYIATEKAQIAHIPGQVTPTDLIAAVEGAGYGVVQADPDQQLADVEQAARETEIHEQTRKFWIGCWLSLSHCSFSAWRVTLRCWGLGPMPFGVTG